MLVNLLGYDKVEYSKNGKSGSFYKVWCADISEPAKIEFGVRTYEVLCSVRYWDKLHSAVSSGSALHIGWERVTHRPFLYVK